jgi:hypothetical protein
VLWETVLGGNISVSTITFAVKGKQYVAVMTGDGLLTQGLVKQVTPEVKTVGATTLRVRAAGGVSPGASRWARRFSAVNPAITRRAQSAVGRLATAARDGILPLEENP